MTASIRLLVLCLAVGLLGAGVGAQSTGPDVIIGSLSGISNYGSSGGISAFAVGTTSCNIGDTDLLWIANNSDHPVIAQNMYRLLNGRFEQVGQSWLKHGFAALSGSVCDPCTGSGGSVLNPGCSDPYSSGLNGSQGGLGPRFDVNASTGAFGYPFPSNGGSTSGNINRRLQVHNSDLGNSGASYFVEGHYIANDDTAAGNDDNNAAWRAANISGGGSSFNASLTGSTHREEPAIMAWMDADPAVRLRVVDVPNDGRFLVAFKGTAVSGGNWHYEFAVQNLNSHRSARAFTVDLPQGSSISNIGFHDVDYHSNDGVAAGQSFDDTDWTAMLSGNQVRWETDTFAADQNANALRWGTLYNFRFDADVEPPTMTSLPVSIDLFRSGIPATVSASFDPPSDMEIISGNNQSTGPSQSFATPLTVRLTEPGTTNPIVGLNVAFTITQGVASLSAASATTDANGEAGITVNAGTLTGSVRITASTGTSSADFLLSVAGFQHNWIPQHGVLQIALFYDRAVTPFILSYDLPGYTQSTPFGDIHTRIVAGGALLTEDGYGIFGPLNPSIVTNSIGNWQKNILGLQVLAGSGVSIVIEAYFLGQIDIIGPHPIVFN